MKKSIVMAALVLFSQGAFADTGLIHVKSAHDVNETVKRLEAVLDKKGMTLFKIINHTAGAQKAGLRLRPSTVVILGNPKVGTPFMQCGQTAAIDFPQKMLIWKDEKGTVRATYNDPAYIAKRHGVTGCEASIKKISGALANFAKAATKP